MMAENAHLIIESGPDSGRELRVGTGDGVRVGRSSKNDFCLNDPAASRFHCRIFFKEGDGLRVADLGSANQTLLNNKPVQEQRIIAGDRITIGDTVLKVISDGTAGIGAPPAPSASPPAPFSAPVPLPATPAPATGPLVDLGLQPKRASSHGPRFLRRYLLLVGSLVTIFALVVWIPRLSRMMTEPETEQTPDTTPPHIEEKLAVRYEKVDGSSSNVFRYFLLIRDDQAMLELDDLANDRHFKSPLTKVDNASEVLGKLADALKQTGFFELEPEYRGRTQNVYDLRDMTISIGTKTHRVKLLNILAPSKFKAAMSTLEDFGLTEFGQGSWALSRDELVQKAQEAFVEGRTLREESNIRYENRFLAIRKLKECRIYLDSIDPKPNFYREAVSLQEDCETELQQAYDDLRFSAERATRMRDWSEAANVLQIICATIPDRTDERYKYAEQRLITVQRRLER